MGRTDGIGGQLVAELQAWLYEAEADCAEAPDVTARWLQEAPPARTGARGCTCFIAPPCGHCTDHEPLATCGCPAFTLDDAGEHEDSCTLHPA